MASQTTVETKGMVKTITHLTHQTPACQDTPFHEQGRRESDAFSSFKRGIRLRTQPGKDARQRDGVGWVRIKLFSPSLIDGSADDPVPIIDHID